MYPERRPNADELLARVQEDARRAKRGKLTIFLGSAPGVGKTYAMLEAARTERDLRRDVVIGIVETHGRYETAALTIGLELLPRRPVDYRGLKLEELDIDAVLLRHPGVVLVDELAHTNAPSSRHAKRWQDVEEILDAGIDVYTTLNVQHVESLNDVVAQITGVVVRETVPDRLLEQADEIRLVDLPPAELLERLQEGKVYVPEQARRAMEGFFKKGSLTALRELALRQTAERVDEQARSEKRVEGVARAWPLAERILVCVSASPTSARLVRGARRMATRLGAEWIAVYVETPGDLRMSEDARARVAEHLRLAEQLGAETVRLSGENAAEEIAHYARSRNVTKIVVGKPGRARWHDSLRPTFLDELVRATPDIDIHLIAEEEGKPSEAPARAARPRERVRWRGLTAAVLSITACTLLAWFVLGREELADVAMLYLLGIVLVSMRYGYAEAIFAAVLGVVALDLFFVEPYLSFTVADLRHVGTFAVMFIVAVVISRLTKRIRDQADTARRRERRAARLYAMNRELVDVTGVDDVAAVAERHIAEAFDASVRIFLPDAVGRMKASVDAERGFSLERPDVGVVEWVWSHGKKAGLGTDTLPSASALFLFLRGTRGKVGVLGVKPPNSRAFVDPEQQRLLEMFATQIAVAIERVLFSQEVRRTEVELEADRLRSSLLRAISGELQTPLGVITGATTTLLERGGELDPVERRELAEEAHDQAERLNRLVRNLLEITRLASGTLRLQKERQPIAKVIHVALQRLQSRLAGRQVLVRMPPDLRVVPIDDVLMEQVFFNLLDNALKYTPPGSPIAISATPTPFGIEVEVADRGAGIPAPERERIFDRFYRVGGDRTEAGTGIGLAICRGVIEAHGGRIWVEEREGGGSSFRFTLPLEDLALQAAESVMRPPAAGSPHPAP